MYRKRTLLTVAQTPWQPAHGVSVSSNNSVGRATRAANSPRYMIQDGKRQRLRVSIGSATIVACCSWPISPSAYDNPRTRIRISTSDRGWVLGLPNRHACRNRILGRDAFLTPYWQLRQQIVGRADAQRPMPGLDSKLLRSLSPAIRPRPPGMPQSVERSVEYEPRGKL